MLIANTSQIREADRIQIEEFGYSGVLLMENAGRLAFEKIIELSADNKQFVLLAGPGNNGGDVFVIARYMYFANLSFTLIISHPDERYTGDAKINLDILKAIGIECQLYEAGSLSKGFQGKSQELIWIDGLLGTGARPGLKGKILQIVEEVNKIRGECIAIDLPSGLSADTGAVIEPLIPASHTITFQLPKFCHLITPASKYCGQTHVLDIGLWPQVIERLGIRHQFVDDAWAKEARIKRSTDGHKGTYGHVGIIGGSRNMRTAPVLSALGALKSGLGLLTVFGCPGTGNACSNLCPEAMFVEWEDDKKSSYSKHDIELIKPYLSKLSAIVIGPGIGQSRETTEFLENLLPLIQCPIVLDADGINLLAAHTHWWDLIKVPCVLTPHPGEMRRLNPDSDVIGQRLETVLSFSKVNKPVLLLKGAGTIVVDESEKVYINSTGNPGMATPGSGDVLAGVIGALLAQGYSPGKAAALGAFLHGRAGDIAAEQIGQEALSATVIAETLGSAWSSLS